MSKIQTGALLHFHVDIARVSLHNQDVLRRYEMHTDQKGREESAAAAAKTIKPSVFMETNTTFKINAEIDTKDLARDQRVSAQYASSDGYNVHDYFSVDLDATYNSREEALEAARSSYKGADCDGIGCTWEIVEVEN